MINHWNTHPDLVVLKTLLMKHDWTYQYSDDHRAWTKGQAEKDEIRKQMDICCGLGWSKAAKAMYEEYRQI